MKRILFILLTLITLNAYTIEFSADIFGAFNILDYSDDEIFMGGGERGRIRFEGSHTIDKFGGWGRLDVDSLQDSPVGIYGYVFYKPFDMLEFYVTRNPDGHFGLEGNALWNFYGYPGDVLGIAFDRSYTGTFTFSFDDGDVYGTSGFNNAFYSGFTKGAFLTFMPVKGLSINWGVPVFDDIENKDLLKSMTFQVAYDWENIGLFGLTYSGRMDTQIEDTQPPERDEEGEYVYTVSNPWGKSGIIRAYFGTTISIVKFDFGIGYMFPEKNDGDTRKYPISIGAAAAFDISKVNIKTRLLFTGFGSYKYEGKTYKSPTDFIIDVLPSMSLTDNIRGYLNLSLFVNDPDEGKTQTGWSLFPYITIGNVDVYAFYTGLEIIYVEDVYWRIPFGLSVKF